MPSGPLIATEEKPSEGSKIEPLGGCGREKVGHKVLAVELDPRPV